MMQLYSETRMSLGDQAAYLSLLWLLLLGLGSIDTYIGSEESRNRAKDNLPFLILIGWIGIIGTVASELLRRLF